MQRGSVVKCIHLCLTEKIARTVSITKSTVDIVEDGVNLRLTVIDTPGFGDAINNNERYLSCTQSFFVYVALVDIELIQHLEV